VDSLHFYLKLPTSTYTLTYLTVSKQSRFLDNPGDDRWHALERVMHYLNGTVSYEIHSTRYPRVLEGYIVIQIGFQMLMR
jgi:hypothetical protein